MVGAEPSGGDVIIEARQRGIILHDLIRPPDEQILRTGFAAASLHIVVSAGFMFDPAAAGRPARNLLPFREEPVIAFLDGRGHHRLGIRHVTGSLPLQFFDMLPEFFRIQRNQSGPGLGGIINRFGRNSEILHF